MAIDDPLDEHEQSERVLAWLRENGLGLIGGIVLGLAGISGFKWWQHHAHQQSVGLADQYQGVVDAIEASDGQAADKLAALGDGVYADMAALELASTQVEAGRNDEAIKTLRAIKASEPAVTDIVHQRLARLLIDAGQADEALKLLDGAQVPAALEVQGDAQYALGQSEKARAAYSQALTRLDVASPRRRVLELKLTEVGGTPASTEAQS